MAINVHQIIQELRNAAATETPDIETIVDKAAGALLDMAAELEKLKTREYVYFPYGGTTNDK